jgi:hypothetical protein
VKGVGQKKTGTRKKVPTRPTFRLETPFCGGQNETRRPKEDPFTDCDPEFG